MVTVFGHSIDVARRGALEVTILVLAATGGALLGLAKHLNKTT